MDLYQPWTVVVIPVVLVNVAILVVLLLVIRRARMRGQERLNRQDTRIKEPAPTLMVIGPTEDFEPGASAGRAFVIGPSEPIVVAPSATDTLVIGPSCEPPVLVAPPQALTVDPPQRAAWDDRGWLKKSENGQEVYEGNYQIADQRSGQTRRFRGVIVVNRGEVLPYIADPPAELQRHPKHPCFQLFRAPWFKIHWERAAGNVDDAILYIQRVLDEAINERRVA
jgi:hypothetical protein